MANQFFLTLLLSLIVTSSYTLWGQDLQYYYQQGTQACEEGRFQDCLSHFKSANHMRPNHQVIMFQLARAYSFNTNIDSSEYYLKQALSIKADWDLADSAFSWWNSGERFKVLKDFQQTQMSPVNLSKPLLRLSDRTLHIESIAYDEPNHDLYLGSVYQQKIVRANLIEHTITDFKTTAAHGLWSVFGMKVDDSKRHLWVCSVATNLMINADSSIEGSAAIYQFDLDSGIEIARYLLDDQAKHWFGDLTLSTDGTVYVSDSQSNTVYRIDPENQQLIPFIKDDRFLSLQGLDLSEDGRYLMIADYVTGLYRFDLINNKLIQLNSQLDLVSLKSVDGLYVYKNSIITTQNQVVPMRVTQYFLNESGDTIIDYRILEKGNPILNEPTLGVLHNDWFYYVANSQWNGYDQHNNPKSPEELQDIQIMKVQVD